MIIVILKTKTPSFTQDDIMNTLLISGVILTLLGLTLYVKNNKTPANIGVTNGVLAPIPRSPNAVSSQTSDKNKKVDPFPFKKGLPESKTAILEVLEAFTGLEIMQEEKNYIYAVSTTPKMGFHDDIEFFFDERTKVIHFRSASRIGYYDMGVNKERYNLLRKAYAVKN